MGSSDELKHGKLIGAIVFFIMYMTPIVIINFMDERKIMGGQTPIKAVLKQDVDYQDLAGKTRVIKQGEVVELYIVKEGSRSTDTTGRSSVQRTPAFVAVKGFDMFDIAADEFKTVD